jgi:hypothetical protein
MKKSQIEKTSGTRAAGIYQRTHEANDLSITSPDLLADSIREGLSRIPLKQRRDVYDRLLSALDEARVNIGQVLFLLGIPATTSDELTAPEIAKVIRYVRINDAKAMKALVPVLGDLLTAEAEQAKSVQISSRAA